MTSTDLMKQIKELAKTAKQGQFYKDRYEKVTEEVQNAISELQMLLPRSKRVSFGNKGLVDKKIQRLVDAFYQLMLFQEEEISGYEPVKLILTREGLPSSDPYANKFLNLLKEKEGVDVRIDSGRTKTYFYSGKKHPDPETVLNVTEKIHHTE